MKKMFLAFVLVVLMPGCVTTSLLKLDPLTLDGQKKTKIEGVKAVVSEKNVHVTIRPATETFTSEDRPRFVVSVLSTAGAFTFSPQSLQVFVNGNPHKVFTYDELAAGIREKESDEKKKAEKLKEAQYMSGGGGGMNTTTANEQYNSTLYRIERETLEALKELDATALKSIRAEAGKEYSGYVTMETIAEPSLTHEIKVIVTANKETHEFLLNQVEVQK